MGSDIIALYTRVSYGIGTVYQLFELLLYSQIYI